MGAKFSVINDYVDCYKKRVELNKAFNSKESTGSIKKGVDDQKL